MSTLIKILKENKSSFFKTGFLVFLIACFATVFANGSNNSTPNPFAFTVKGKVIDKNEVGLAGATVTEKGTSNATLTAADGSFTINLSQPATLVVTYVGYQTKEIFVREAASDLIITLSTVSGTMESVIVVGYGTQRKLISTAAVSTVKGEQLAVVPAPNISNALAGRTTGIITRARGGRPGDDNQDIYVRGVATRGTNKGPLIVVDGIQRNNINEIDPNNIESVSILKDAAAVAPFGLGGANGVILITTKKGINGAPSISISGYMGDQQPTYVPKMLDALDYMRLKSEADVLAGNPPTYTQTFIDSYLSNHQQDPDKYPVSNALDQIMRKHSPIYQGNLQVRGGNQIVKYFAGIGYFQQEGMFDNDNYSRYNYNLNLDVNVTPITTASFSLNGSSQKTTEIDGGSGQMFRSVYKFLPIAALWYSNGLPGENSGNTPGGVLASKGYNRRNTNNLLSTIAIEQKLPFIKGLGLKGTISYDPYNYVNKQYHQPFVFYARNGNTNPPTYTRSISNQENSTQGYSFLQQNYWQQNTLTLQGIINYHNTFGKHDITGLAVAETRKAKQFDFMGRRNNFGVDIDELSLGSSNKNDFDNGGGSGTSSTVGYVYRVSYAYNKKYLAEASGRYDGHYHFAPGHRWVYLPAFSLGWNISNEKFFEPVRFVDNLKIRGSWGKSAIPAGGAFAFLYAYTLRGNAYSFGDGTMVQGSYVDFENNPNITWEQSKKIDGAIEATLFKGALRFEADYFYEKRSNMLLNPDIIVPQEYGLRIAQTNAGIMENRGVELTLGSSKRFDNGLQISLDANFTYARNKLIQIFETKTTYNIPGRRETGKRQDERFGYKSLGLFSPADDKDRNDTIDKRDGYNIIQFGTLRPGDIRYADLSGPNGVPDGKIDIYDQTAIGSPQTPGIIYGINLSANWKGFDLTALAQGASISDYNVYGFMTVAHFSNNSNSAYEYYNNRWTPTNQNAKYPRAYGGTNNNNGQTSDFWLVNSSYLRLKTVSLGYTVPSRLSSKVRMKNLRLYVTGQNIFTMSKLKFTDPETTGEQGYPLQKTFLAGFNITF
jgi:TonB-linked SusC/RagA family outer membrane protein